MHAKACNMLCRLEPEVAGENQAANSWLATSSKELQRPPSTQFFDTADPWSGKFSPAIEPCLPANSMLSTVRSRTTGPVNPTRQGSKKKLSKTFATREEPPCVGRGECQNA